MNTRKNNKHFKQYNSVFLGFLMILPTVQIIYMLKPCVNDLCVTLIGIIKPRDLVESANSGLTVVTTFNISLCDRRVVAVIWQRVGLLSWERRRS